MDSDLATDATAPTDRQLVGLDEGHLVAVEGGGYLHAAAAEAFQRLREEAREAGFELALASAYRSFDRQLAIWNGKLDGRRPVHDDRGEPVDLLQLSPLERIHAVLRFSALPGTSRHHWGTDLDVYDAAALAVDAAPALTPAEVAPGGIFDPLHCWLDERIDRAGSHGFMRPYARDRGGVAPERWHLSFAPLARQLEARLTPALVRAAWREVPRIAGRAQLEEALPALLTRYTGGG